MNAVIFSDNYYFIKYSYTNSHYTDNRAGSPRNYLAYMINGSARIVSERCTLTVKAGDVFFIPKGLSYQSFWYGQPGVSHLSFGFYELNTHESLSYGLQKITCDAETLRLVREIPTGAITCRSLSAFYAAMARILPQLKATAESHGESIINRAKQCIRENPFASVGEIADMCAMSSAYLYALFKRVAGTTPNSYRQRILCERAVELLTSTDKKVEEISEMLKFSSGSYFRKVLKKHTGKSPADIRKTRSF